MKELINLLQEYNTTEDAWILRFFRVYLDGSYDNELGAKFIRTEVASKCHNITVGIAPKLNKIQLKAQVITAFINFLKVEFSDLTRYKIRKAIFKAFEYSKATPEKLDAFNEEIIKQAVSVSLGK